MIMADSLKAKRKLLNIQSFNLVLEITKWMICLPHSKHNSFLSNSN